MTHKIHFILGGLGAGMAIFVLSGFLVGSKPLSGKYMPQAALVNGTENAGCQVDKGDRWLMMIADEVHNPLFEYSPDNEVRLYLQMDSMPNLNERITLPHKGVEVCYREKGSMLMFETFRATGWIELTERKKNETLIGRLEVNLIEPHHNFSNSDFHRLNCSFKLRKELIESF